MKISILIMIYLISSNAWGVSSKLLNSLCIAHKAKDCDLVHSIVWKESNYINTTIQDMGSLSYGPGQIKCATAKAMGLKFSCDQLVNPKVSLKFAILYINHQLKRYDNDIRKSIAAYNAGSAIVCKHYNAGKCYPKEFINERYVWEVYRRYQWQRKKKQERQPKYLPPYKNMVTSARYQIGSKSAYQILLDATKSTSSE